MSTKYTDGCYSKAEDKEELFTLLARDKSAPFLVWLWAVIRWFRDGSTCQVKEAFACARKMKVWRKENRK